MLLAGTAAFLYGHVRRPRERALFLLTRGLWLVLLELTIVRFAWVPDPTYTYIFVQVIWAIGCSMVLLAPLSLLPPRAVALIGALVVVLHNLLDPITAESLGSAGIGWAILHERAGFELFRGRHFVVLYPLVPWIGVIALGYGLGEIYTRSDRPKWLFVLGAALTIAFVGVRALNVYGDPEPWSLERDALFTVMSFLNCEKYPPSLSYLLMTLGPILLALAALDRVNAAWIEPLAIFGRVPLFFYVAHLYLLRITAGALAYSRWGMDAFTPPPHGHAGSPGYPLVSAYFAWAAALLLLLPACRWFGALKRRRAGAWWVSYV